MDLTGLPPLQETKLNIPFQVGDGGAFLSSQHAQSHDRNSDASVTGTPVSHPEGPQHIVGILAHRVPLAQLTAKHPESTVSSSSVTGSTVPRRPLAVLLHGILSHKDQIYHRKLVQSLDIDSFRFDFRANYETKGEWNMANFYDDIDDLRCVILYLRNELNYDVQLLVGHSRGSLDGWTYFSTFKEQMEAGGHEAIPFFVSVSGRFRMERIHDRDPIYEPAFEKDGYYTWKVKVAGQEISARVRPEDVRAFASFPIADHAARFPVTSDALLLHGTHDTTVPPADVGLYMNMLTSQGRRPGSCRIHLVEKADHHLRGHFDEVVEVICKWYAGRRELLLRRAPNGASVEGVPSGAMPAAAAPSGNAAAEAAHAWEHATASRNTPPGRDVPTLEQSWQNSVAATQASSSSESNTSLQGQSAATDSPAKGRL